MFRQECRKPRIAKKHFDGAGNSHSIDYPHRLSFYILPPTAEVTLDQFEQWAIDRLRGINLSLELYCKEGCEGVLTEWLG